MTLMTDGPVRTTSSQLLRRPFKLNLPGPGGPTGEAVASVPQPVPVEAPDAKPVTQLSREQILDATAHCLDAEGYDGTTIRKIAKRLDCAVGSIYRYFTDKRELLDAVVQARFRPVVEALADGEGLEETTRQYVAIAVNRPEQYRLMFWLGAVGRAPGQPTVLPAVVNEVIAGWADRLDGYAQGQRHWGTLHGELMLGLHDGVATPAEQPAVPA